MIARRLVSLFAVRTSAAYSSSAPKQKSAQMVLLMGLDGKVIGTKSRAEAEAIAKKDKLMLKRTFTAPGKELKAPCYILHDPKTEFDPVEGEDDSAPVSITNPKKKKVPHSGVREKKKVFIGANINDHDIETKAKQISKFLRANGEVQIIASGTVKNERLEEVYKQFEKLFPGLRFVQKILKPGILKFTILPDPEKFTGPDLDKSQSHDNVEADEELRPEDFIDDKELEELIEQKLKEKKD